MDIKDAQSNLRHGYVGGASGLFASATMWLAAGVVAAGDAAPSRWRKTARLVLFAPERPYLRS